MGNTCKGAAKTAAKMEKMRRKLARKCKGQAKGNAAIALAFAFLALVGCQQVPSRSQTLTMRDCVVNIYGCGDSTNAVPMVEIATQAMSVENSGTETLTPSQTTDTKPDIDVTVGAKTPGILESSCSKLLSGTGSEITTATATTTDACADGQCSE
ncbi:MAG: hypothetical protein ACI305_05915 [Lepagella sp.]